MTMREGSPVDAGSDLVVPTFCPAGVVTVSPSSSMTGAVRHRSVSRTAAVFMSGAKVLRLLVWNIGSHAARKPVQYLPLHKCRMSEQTTKSPPWLVSSNNSRNIASLTLPLRSQKLSV